MDSPYMTVFLQHGVGEHERFIQLTINHSIKILEKNDINYHITRRDRLMPWRTPHWDKIYLIYAALQNPYVDKIIWADADTLLHPGFDITEVEFQPGKIGCVKHVGVGGWKGVYDNWHYNTGVMIIHGGETALQRERLKYFLALAMETDDIKEPYYWYEQSVLLELSLQDQFSDIFYQIPDKFNSNFVNPVEDWYIKGWHGIRDYDVIYEEMNQHLKDWARHDKESLY